MTEPTPGATEPSTTDPAAGSEPELTDDHAQALLADAIATADALNGKQDDDTGVKFDGDYDPERAASLIAKLRAEKAAMKGSATKAADAARAELAQTIGKALGLVQDDEPADPAKLTAQLSEESAAARQAKLELAVYRAAQGSTADPAALLDSRAFLSKVAALDPSDTDAITAAITEAVTVNPRLGRPEPQGMKRNPAQGASASPPLGVNERIAAAEKAGDIKTAIRLKSGMALNTNQ